MVLTNPEGLWRQCLGHHKQAPKNGVNHVTNKYFTKGQYCL